MQLFYVNGYLTGLGCKSIPFHADDITYVHQLFEDIVVQGVIFSLTDFVPVNEKLNFATVILNVNKGGFAHAGIGPLQ